MPKCPNCGKEIEYLQNVFNCYHRVDCTLNHIDHLIQYHPETEKSWGADDSSWNCPECDAELFYSEENAENFLKGEYENGK